MLSGILTYNLERLMEIWVLGMLVAVQILRSVCKQLSKLLSLFTKLHIP